ncbi:hypothetical protein [Chryseobacterium panacisoli]|uniref:hypothetical protein n=1 Tax=Chryseobacterium panacisoli TaxID=1807141 RepID=UPI00155A51FB|nr:hypothetical protein [Chryseobacterium panacisoli]
MAVLILISDIAQTTKLTFPVLESVRVEEAHCVHYDREVRIVSKGVDYNVY